MIKSNHGAPKMTTIWHPYQAHCRAISCRYGPYLTLIHSIVQLIQHDHRFIIYRAMYLDPWLHVSQSILSTKMFQPWEGFSKTTECMNDEDDLWCFKIYCHTLLLVVFFSIGWLYMQQYTWIKPLQEILFDDAPLDQGDNTYAILNTSECDKITMRATMYIK